LFLNELPEFPGNGLELVAAPAARGRRGNARPFAVDADLLRALHAGGGDEPLSAQVTTERG
jgi:CTP:molybdopterin cytidylyltransferase MocA